MKRRHWIGGLDDLYETIKNRKIALSGMKRILLYLPFRSNYLCRATHVAMYSITESSI
jgi:hypothetical protein